MTLAQKESIKALIFNQIQQLQKQIEQLQNKSVTIVKDCSLDALNKADMHYEHQREYTLVEQAQTRISLLEETLQRVDRPEYGLCVECEEQIALRRLELLPESLYCVECLSEQQSKRKRL